MSEQQLGISPYTPTAEEKEALVTLQGSHYWKIYRKILMGLKEGTNIQLLASTDQTLIVKKLGEVVGLNLAINQLDALVAQFKRQELNDKLKEEAKNLKQ